MTITAYSGPMISFGITMSSTAGTGLLGNNMENNGQRAPDVSDLGHMMMDPRVAYAYQPGSGVTVDAFGFYRGVGSVDFVPATANASAFQATATGSSGVTTFTLAAASSAGGTFSTTIIAPETGRASGTLIAIDSTAAFVTFGSDGTVAAWNAGAGTGRNITIRPSSNLDGGSFSVAGRDMYGFKMTETIAAGSTVLAGRKAFKYISSITNATTPTSTGVSIGFGDVFGFPLFVPYAGQNAVANWNSSASNSLGIALSTANFVIAMGSTVTATSTTADVRGTFLSTTATNAVIRIQLTVTPTASGVSTITSTNVAPLFGGTQFSSV